jgi:uncharacterized membrane protein YccC
MYPTNKAARIGRANALERRLAAYDQSPIPAAGRIGIDTLSPRRSRRCRDVLRRQRSTIEHARQLASAIDEARRLIRRTNAALAVVSSLAIEERTPEHAQLWRSTMKARVLLEEGADLIRHAAEALPAASAPVTHHPFNPALTKYGTVPVTEAERARSFRSTEDAG